MAAPKKPEPLDMFTAVYAAKVSLAGAVNSLTMALAGLSSPVLAEETAKPEDHRMVLLAAIRGVRVALHQAERCLGVEKENG